MAKENEHFLKPDNQSPEESEQLDTVSMEPSQEIWNSTEQETSELQSDTFLSPATVRNSQTTDGYGQAEIVPATPSFMSAAGDSEEVGTPGRSLSEVFSASSLGQRSTRAADRESLQRHELGTNSFSLFSPEKEISFRNRKELEAPSGAAEEIERRVIWGTNVNVDECEQKIKKFLYEFTATTVQQDYEDGDGLQQAKPKPYYLELLTHANEMQYEVINIDLQHVFEFDSELYAYVVTYPTELIAIFDQTLQEVCKEMFATDDSSDIMSSGTSNFHAGRLITRMYNMKDTEIHSMREIDPSHIHQMIGVRGMVVRCSSVIPNMNRAFYSCNNCHWSLFVDIQRGKIEEPIQCDKCQARNSFMLIHNRSVFSDKQMIRIQETPETVPQGETPATMTIVAYDSLVDSARPGDQIEVTGILRAVSVRINPKQRSIRSVFRTYIDAIHILKGKQGRLSNSTEHMDTTSDYYPIGSDTSENALYYFERERSIREISQDPLLYDKLSRSIAPSIYGHEDLKKGILLQLFGGTRKDFSASGGGHFRSDIHVLLVGDPGTSKSLFLQYVHRIAPRGLYTSGRGSSAVGLTAYVTRDPDSNDMVLESGALVLSDKGICCIDEFDKMTDSTRSILHEAMEQQTVSIAKAGIICSLNARTSVLAAANPVESRYNPKLSVVDNIQLPPTLLSRFDLIYLILDNANPEEDKRLGNHITSLFSADTAVVHSDEDPLPSLEPATIHMPNSSHSFLDSTTLASYISYAREKVHPKLNDDAVQRLTKGYVEMRRMGNASKSWSGGIKTITATPRQLESLIRLSEAHAKMRLSDVVESQDVDEALRLVQVAMQQSAIDPITGTIDMDLITTGKSATKRSRIAKLGEAIFQYLQQTKTSDTAVRTSDVLMEVKRSSSMPFTEQDFDDAIHYLVEEERIFRVAGGLRVGTSW
ncbi:DNA replication licensing factor MCM4 [Galdieria sulphuraria]|uniref:DNA replication licensing factor MCM4 n=1 Tax=Galdieria sulphuraria TaxID=130081 RepID=M2XPA8_GALSU|nr:minichromosome maintenance family (MCM) [Galdieria sulphuraria]EME32022.1 minichromosome maintenance family (MCM) [Galdieria sulphuraria]GJD09889.1 DNA replication licensing factor MCM4 [Galdieria sulphuraria]|eukprot:XP_005708542.1 minichromosome maintenance family (MCM) [Galdieria sulphuraria]